MCFAWSVRHRSGKLAGARSEGASISKDLKGCTNSITQLKGGGGIAEKTKTTLPQPNEY